jgi:NAD(P)-dependent dehydrogenase (short-subunit alcohol dehydrogenase family)
MAHKVVLVLGAGKNVGSAAVSKFKSKGYKVAAVSRNPIAEVRRDADLVLSADFSDPNCFAGIFERVEGELGLPNVVIYNGKLHV